MWPISEIHMRTTSKLMSRIESAVLLLALASAAGCERSATEPERKNIVLRIEGTVRSANTEVAIPGATVELVRSLNLFMEGGTPAVAVVADSQGRYAIEHTISVANPSRTSPTFGCSSCPDMAVRASAAGYETSNMKDPTFHIGYSEVRRYIDIPLKPVNR